MFVRPTSISFIQMDRSTIRVGDLFFSTQRRVYRWPKCNPCASALTSFSFSSSSLVESRSFGQCVCMNLSHVHFNFVLGLLFKCCNSSNCFHLHSALASWVDIHIKPSSSFDLIWFCYRLRGHLQWSMEARVGQIEKVLSFKFIYLDLSPPRYNLLWHNFSSSWQKEKDGGWR